MSNLNRNKTPCKHDWLKIQGLLEKKLYQEVIDEIEKIDTLTDLLYTLDAYLGLGKSKKAKEILDYWRYRISNPVSDSYWIFYEALIKIDRKQIEDAQLDLKKALGIAKRENDEHIKKKIQEYLQYT